MLAVIVFLFKRVQNDLDMFVVAQEIRVAGIDHQGFYIVLFDVLRVGKLQVEQVVIGYGLFIRTVAFFDILLKLFYRYMQVDEDVGLGKLLVDDVEQFLVQMKFLFRQVCFGKEEAFCKQVIGDGDVLEKVFGVDELLQLLVSLGHKEQLKRKSVLFGVFVELGKEGIVCKFFQY